MSYFTFTMPPSAGGGDFTMRRLTVGETEDILASQDPKKAVRVTGDLVRRALVAFHGARVPTGAEGEAWWRGLDARVGALLSAAYTKIHTTEADEDADFFGTMEARAEPPKVI